MCARHVINLWYMLYMLSIYAHRYDATLYCMGTTMGTFDMGIIGIILFQHIVTARTSYAIGLKHNTCLFWDDIIHVIMYLLAPRTSSQSQMSVDANRNRPTGGSMFRRGGVGMYHQGRLGVGLRYCDTNHVLKRTVSCPEKGLCVETVVKPSWVTTVSIVWQSVDN